jgi:hypothetical protein
MRLTNIILSTASGKRVNFRELLKFRDNVFWFSHFLSLPVSSSPKSLEQPAASPLEEKEDDGGSWLAGGMSFVEAASAEMSWWLDVERNRLAEAAWGWWDGEEEKGNSRVLSQVCGGGSRAREGGGGVGASPLLRPWSSFRTEWDMSKLLAAGPKTETSLLPLVWASYIVKNILLK